MEQSKVWGKVQRLIQKPLFNQFSYQKGQAICLRMLTLFCLLALFSGTPTAKAEETAQSLYRKAYQQQLQYRTQKALSLYQQALQKDPNHAPSHYEIGWSYWLLEKWPKVVQHWKRAQALKIKQPDLPRYLKMARARAAKKPLPLHKPAIGTKTSGNRLQLELMARFQAYHGGKRHARDYFDAVVSSPKSARFSQDGQKVYVNALESYATIVYDAKRLRRIKVITHRFGAAQAKLFDAEETKQVAAAFKNSARPKRFNTFKGKPVESVLSHQGRYLWVSLYRRGFDHGARLPSALSVIDTQTDRIVRVLPTGTIPKSLAISPDQQQLAVALWGDNVVDLIDISSKDPKQFRREGQIVVGKRLRVPADVQVSRDHYCGYCLRGLVYSSDGKNLLVGRMRGGGVAVLDPINKRMLGVVTGMKPTPRHMVRSLDGRRVYISSNLSGYVSVYDIQRMVSAVSGRKSSRKTASRKVMLPPEKQAYVGTGLRTISLTKNGQWLLAVANRNSRLLALDASTLKKVAQIRTNSYPVGMGISPNGKQIWVTSQGRSLRGGNAITIYRLTTP